MPFLFFLVKLCCQAIYASLYSTPTPGGCKTNGWQHIITANTTPGWWREVTVERITQDKERNRGWKSAGPSEAVARVSMSHCNYLSVTSATESPSNRSVVPKHLANAQLTSTDVGTHWHLIPLPADRFIRQKERKRRRRDGNIQ